MSSSTSPIQPQPHPPKSKAGFLPIKTNTFDRIFISVVCFIALHLLWMRFLEASFSLWIATAISVILGGVMIRWG